MHSSLRGLVEEHADIPVNVTLSILNDVCCGLQYLHSRKPPIVHQNLTPNNILLCYHFKAKISDIGIVNTIDTQTLQQATKMHPFVPLKFLPSKSVNECSLDIFSFGGVILYISSHQWPQTTPLTSLGSDTGGSTELQRCQQHLDKMAESYANLKPLVISCLDGNPEKRPSVVKVLTRIKKERNSYNEKLYSSIWTTEVSGEQQSLTVQLQAQTEQEHWQQEEKQHQQDLEQKHQLDTQQPQLLKVSCICYIICMSVCMYMHVCTCSVMYMYICMFVYIIMCTCYCIAGMFGRESLANLANGHNFAKLKPSKRHMHIT